MGKGSKLPQYHTTTTTITVPYKPYNIKETRIVIPEDQVAADKRKREREVWSKVLEEEKNEQ